MEMSSKRRETNSDRKLGGNKSNKYFPPREGITIRPSKQ